MCELEFLEDDPDFDVYADPLFNYEFEDVDQEWLGDDVPIEHYEQWDPKLNPPSFFDCRECNGMGSDPYNYECERCGGTGKRFMFANSFTWLFFWPMLLTEWYRRNFYHCCCGKWEKFFGFYVGKHENCLPF